MASGQTANYGLNQWEPGDQVLREEFNGDNRKIDLALKGKADQGALEGLQGAVEQKADTAALEELRESAVKMAAGAYTGDGAASRLIGLAFTPRAVYVCTSLGVTYADGTNLKAYYYGGLAVAGHGTVAPNDAPLLTLQEGGFLVYSGDAGNNNYIRSNEKGTTFHYIAFG